MNSEPIATIFSNRNGPQSFSKNVASCMMGNVGLNRAKNRYKQASRKGELIFLDLISSDTLDDYTQR